MSGTAAPVKRAAAAGDALDVSMHLELEGMVAGTRGANLKVTSGDVMMGEGSYEVTSGKVVIRGGKVAVSMAMEGEDGKKLKVTMTGKLNGAIPAEGESADISFSKAAVAWMWKLDVAGELTNTTFFSLDEEAGATEPAA